MVESVSHLGKEGGQASKHLIYQDTTCPPIDCFVIALLVDELGGIVFRCTADSVSQLIRGLEHLCHTKVNNLDVAICVQHDILKFEISVHNSFFVKFAEADNDLSNEKLNCRFIKSLS